MTEAVAALIWQGEKQMICLSDDHKTTENIRKTGAFTVNFATTNTVVPCDYVGIVSANDVPDKFVRAGFLGWKEDKIICSISKIKSPS